jgi:hypothetical protein
MVMVLPATAFTVPRCEVDVAVAAIGALACACAATTGIAARELDRRKTSPSLCKDELQQVKFEL